MTSAALATLDTNIAVYAMTESAKKGVATQALRRCSFLSVQVLNEYANLSVRKYGRSWTRVADELQSLSESVIAVPAIELVHHRHAIWIAERYQLSFYDSLMLAVALANDAKVIFSEDMQHGMLIDGALTIINPFLNPDPL